jgi:DNA-binding MarR family transcriptional regulator
VHIYDKYLKLVKETASAKTELNQAIKDLDIPELYIYDQRYTVLFLIAEICVRDKGYFISNDLKNETNLSDKSVERLINFLVKKDLYHTKIGKDKRRKLYYPSKNLHKHIMSTWSVRIRQNEAIKDFGIEDIKDILSFFKNTKDYPFPDNKDHF